MNDHIIFDYFYIPGFMVLVAAAIANTNCSQIHTRWTIEKRKDHESFINRTLFSNYCYWTITTNKGELNEVISCSITDCISDRCGATCYTSWVAYTQSLWTRDAKVHVEIAEVAPKVSGEIVTVAVHDNQFVNAGDLLFAIDDADYKNSVSQAKYAMLKAEAELEQSKNSYRRDSRLLSKN